MFLFPPPPHPPPPHPPIPRYYSQCMFHSRGQELADSLKVCMINALRRYHEINGAFPDRIVVYRDGVGDGQVRGCLVLLVSAHSLVPSHSGENSTWFLLLQADSHGVLRVNTRHYTSVHGFCFFKLIPKGV